MQLAARVDIIEAISYLIPTSYLVRNQCSVESIPDNSHYYTVTAHSLPYSL